MDQRCYEFEAVIESTPDGKGAFVRFPLNLRKEFGVGRLKVDAAFDGVPYAGSLVNMGGEKPGWFHLLYSRRAQGYPRGAAQAGRRPGACNRPAPRGARRPKRGGIAGGRGATQLARFVPTGCFPPLTDPAPLAIIQLNKNQGSLYWQAERKSSTSTLYLIRIMPS